MQHTVDGKRQFLSNKIKLKRSENKFIPAKVKKILRKSEPQFRKKVKKIEAQEKNCFSYKKNVYCTNKKRALDRILACF